MVIDTVARLNPRVAVGRVPDGKMLDTLYRLAKPLLFRLDAETAHRLTLALLAGFPASAPAAAAPELMSRVVGLRFAAPGGFWGWVGKGAGPVGARPVLGIWV